MSSLIDFLSKETGLAKTDVNRIVRSAPKRYKVYHIPKRSGGNREIAQPARELKLIQRLFVDHYLAPLPVHNAATAYERGRNLRDNVEPHAVHGPILKMDFKDFFPSIHGADWLRYCAKKDLLSEEDRRHSANILFRMAKGERTLKLSIGAPSSPKLCNVLMYDFDEYVTSEAAKRSISYTRYADDMTFSGQRIGMLKDMVEVVNYAKRKSIVLHLSINHDKTKFITPKFRRCVTGLNISNDGSISIGRDNKRRIRSQVHHALNNSLLLDERYRLVGMLAYIKSVEPEFLRRLDASYDCDVMARVRDGLG